VASPLGQSPGREFFGQAAICHSFLVNSIRSPLARSNNLLPPIAMYRRPVPEPHPCRAGSFVEAVDSGNRTRLSLTELIRGL